MNRALSNYRPVRSLAGLLGLVLFGCVFDVGSLAAEKNAGVGPNPINAVTQIECITPDGRVLAVSPTAQNASATIKDDAITCPLREGQTVFIVAFAKVGLLDRLMFVNENATACGELTISVSNTHLAADSPAWTEVDGVIPFARKRLFNLSMLGVEAKYVKLSFRVQSALASTVLSGSAFASADAKR